MIKDMRGSYIRTFIIRKKNSISNIGKMTGIKNPNYKHGKTHNNKCLCGSSMSLKAKKCQSCNQKELRLKQWKTNSYRNKFCDIYLKGRKLLKNKQEKIIHKLIGNKYRFNNKTKIYGFIPDFVNDSENKIIEFFGTYWHKNLDRDKKRLILYKKTGYKTLVIWDIELKDINKLKIKIRKFNEKY